MKTNRPAPREGYHRVQATMPPDMVEWLEGIGRRCKQQYGYKISKCEVIRACIEAARESEPQLDLSEVRTEEELKARILDALQSGSKRRKR